MESGGLARTHRDCPACGTAAASSSLVRYQHPDWPMRCCSKCDLIYLEFVPEYGALYDEISWTKQHKKEEQRRLKAMPILGRLDMWTRWRLGLFGDATPAGGLNAWAKPGPVLDVGCSIGKGFDKLKADRIPHGIEIDAKAAAIAQEKFAAKGGAVVNSDGVGGLKQLPAKQFTGVTLWSYLEHEANPRDALLQTRRVLTDDGIALVKVPNFNCVNRMVLGRNWPGFRHPDHVQYFTPSTLGAMARDAGFAVKFRLYGRIPTNDNMYAILRPA